MLVIAYKILNLEKEDPKISYPKYQSRMFQNARNVVTV